LAQVQTISTMLFQNNLKQLRSCLKLIQIVI
jgi:hypothetical protein